MLKGKSHYRRGGRKRCGYSGGRNLRIVDCRLVVSTEKHPPVAGKKIIVSCRGASSYVEEAFKVSFELNINNKLWAVPCFCCRGVGLGWDDFG